MSPKPSKYALVTTLKEATSAGYDIASAGGNAIDVGIAAAFTLLVGDIMMCSIGGGGFAIIKTPDNKIEIIDFFDNMPGKGIDIKEFRANCKPNIVEMNTGLDMKVMIGHATVPVPGAVKGLDFILNRHGTMPIRDIVQPATSHARNGTIINKTIYDCFLESYDTIHWLSPYEKSILSTEDGQVPHRGYRLKQTDLANTLELIGQYGSDVIYKGDIAKSIVEEVQSGCGLVTYEDLSTYEPIIRMPLKSKYRSFEIFTNPPPSVGGATLFEILNILSLHEFKQPFSPADISVIAKAQNQALFDKFNKYLDPETNEEVAKELLSDHYSRSIYKKISPTPHTTHLSCIDDSGYAIGITMSMGYDSGVPIPGTGIFMSNSLGEMDLNPAGYLNNTPGRRLISGMTPSIAVNTENNDTIVLGGAGSARIPTSLAQVIINLTDRKMDLSKAIATPRVHFEENRLAVEPGVAIDMSLFSEETKLCQFKEQYKYFGGTQCAIIKDNIMPKAVNDPRRSGSAQTMIC